MKNKFITENWVNILTIIFSLTALSISIKSCITSDDSFNLALKQYQSDKYIVLNSKINDNDILLTPTDPNILFQRGIIYLPSEIENDSIKILPPNKSIPILRFKNNLQKLIKSKVKVKKGTFGVSIDAFIPIIIESYYVAKGQSFGDRSFYFLTFQFVAYDDEYQLPEIEFTGLTFIERIDLNYKDFRVELDRIFKSENGIYIPYNKVDDI